LIASDIRETTVLASSGWGIARINWTNEKGENWLFNMDQFSGKLHPVKEA
jgi:hypothetical protein